MRRLFMLAGVASIAFASVASAASFTNGSFEDPTVGGAFQTLTPASQGLTGWTIASGTLVDVTDGTGSIDQIGNYWKAQDGNQSLDMNGSPGTNTDQRGKIFQSFDTVPGQKYTVSFYMSGNPDLPGFNGVLNSQPARSYSVQVNAPGFVDTFVYLSNTNTKSNMQWAAHVFTFTATGTSSKLTFDSTVPVGFYGAALDNVKVSAVPLPASAWGGLSLLGLFGAARARARKVQNG